MCGIQWVYDVRASVKVHVTSKQMQTIQHFTERRNSWNAIHVVCALACQEITEASNA